MQTADFNHTDFNDSMQAEADKVLLVRFFLRPKENKTATLKEGRPVFVETEYIEIRVPGKRDPQTCRPVRAHDIDRFPEHYRRFKARVSEPEDGMPLREWPQVTRSQAEELAFMNIKTVEQLAGMTDSNAMNFHGGLNLKQRAKEWLEQSEQTKGVAEREQMQATIATQAEQIAQLTAQVAQLAEGQGVQTASPDLVSELDAAEPEKPEKPPTKRRARRGTAKKG